MHTHLPPVCCSSWAETGRVNALRSAHSLLWAEMLPGSLSGICSAVAGVLTQFCCCGSERAAYRAWQDKMRFSTLVRTPAHRYPAAGSSPA